MKRLYTIIAGLFACTFIHAQIPNWSENIASILYARCTNCHNPNGIAPFSLIDYSDAVASSIDIKNDVYLGKMPPWPPDANYTHLAHERLLTAQEKADIISWIDNGTPLGNINLAPTPPVYSGVAQMASPDLISQMPTYNVNTTTDLYRCFVMPSNLNTAKYITEMEVLPGNRGVVHHILIYSDSTNTPATLDAADPGPGYTNFGGTGSFNSKLIGAWVPGSGLISYPSGMGVRLPAHTNIIFQVHYPGGISNQVDSSQVRFHLASAPMRQVSIDPVLNHYQLDNGPLSIPANTIRTFTAHYTLTAGVSLLGIAPHMHLIGNNISSWAITPASDTIPFVNIPDWDFHWQGSYAFPRVLHLTSGTTIYSSATYDNTSNNPENPNDPPHLVTLGESTTDEMMLVYFTYTSYFPGDEYIIQDSNLVITSTPAIRNEIVHSLQVYEPYPNPSSNGFEISCFVPEPSNLRIVLMDASGKITWEQKDQALYSGMTSFKIPALHGLKGSYLLQMDDGKTRKVKKILIE